MPAHIFLQLGLWEEAAAADRVAYDASVEWTTRRGLSAGVRNYHALSWHEYELLQLGRYRDAEQTLHTLEPLASRGDNLILLNDYASMRARFVVETERWDLMAGQTTFTNVNDLFAVGLSVAHLGRRSDAERVHSLLAQRAQAMEEGDLRPAIAIMERELAAAIAAADGRTDEAIATLSAAARAELALPPPVGLPQPIKPAPEMLGELLVTSGRPGDAIEWFERALRRNANRSPSVAGLARARAAIQTSTAPPPSTRHSLKVVPYTSRALALGSVLAAVLIAVVVMRRRAKKKGPAPVKGAGPKASAKRRRQKR